MKLMASSYRKFVAAGLVAVLLFGLVAALHTQTAAAHGRRDLVGGKYQIVFGFLSEPALTGTSNGIDLTVCQGACVTNADGSLKNPVLGVEKTLKAQTIYGSQTLDVALSPRFRADGKYNAYFTPAKAGEYTFRFYGTINGDAIDERVVSSKDGFNSVDDPKLLPAGQSSTSNLEQQVKDANDKASSATTFGIIGLVMGALGLVLGGLSLGLRSRAAQPGKRSPVESSAGHEVLG
jgi:hypothetical protein